MRKLALLVLTALMLFAMAAPALAVDGECDASPWCGKVRSQGYWKNDGNTANDTAFGYSFGTPAGGDYKQIFVNQAIAWHNNYLANPVCGDVAFRDTYFQGPCGAFFSMYEIDQMVHDAFANIDTMSREDLLKLKSALDAINNNYSIYVLN